MSYRSATIYFITHFFAASVRGAFINLRGTGEIINFVNIRALGKASFIILTKYSDALARRETSDFLTSRNFPAKRRHLYTAPPIRFPVFFQ